ncbi:MAG: SDR family NAD(P)-dependent oxidoreductase [Caulobacteraceae bacterium]
MRELAGKVAFITGGASGIGLSMARAFGAQGMSVMIADIEEAALEGALADLRASQIRCEAVAVDVASREAVRRAAEATIEAFGKAHVVCNNAGVGAGGTIGEVSEGDWRWVIEVNLLGVVHGMEVFAPILEAQGGGGHFVNTASIAGLVSPAGMEPYCATKFAVTAMSEGWAAQFAPKGIGVSILCPGFVRTRIHESRRNRPAAYGLERRRDPDPEAPPSPVLSGIDPAIVGERVVEAVRDDDLYVFTHPEFRAAVKARFDRILAAFDKESPGLAGSAPEREAPSRA